MNRRLREVQVEKIKHKVKEVEEFALEDLNEDISYRWHIVQKIKTALRNK